MATQNEMLESKYIQKSDLVQPTRITVAGCTREDIGKDGKSDMKWIVSFQGNWKPMILNVTNTKAFFRTLGPDSDGWAGKQIVLFNDMTVEYNNEYGGIRVYQQMDIVDSQAPAQAQQSQFTADNNLAQNPPRTDETGPLPVEPPF
jgi:hypothetical protein